jgi:hypothetical protein
MLALLPFAHSLKCVPHRFHKIAATKNASLESAAVAVLMGSLGSLALLAVTFRA